MKILLVVVAVIAFAKLVLVLHQRPSLAEIWQAVNNGTLRFHRLRPDLLHKIPYTNCRSLVVQHLGANVSVIYWQFIRTEAMMEHLQVLVAGKRERWLHFADGHPSYSRGGPSPFDPSDSVLAEQILWAVRSTPSTKL